jgi:diacylglycerol O-acyltransferase
MAYSHYERLSALDAAFLSVEDQNAHMHVGAVSVFAAAPLVGRDGTINMDRVRNVVEAGLHRAPRYQQKLAHVPVFGYPVWVDDEHFNINYHVRHSRLPKPGDERQLKRLAGRIMSQQLDRSKPLWELWVIEGLDTDRIATIVKAHHCMIDGVGSVELTGAWMEASAEVQRAKQPKSKFIPRPAPTGRDLLLGELARRAEEPVKALRAARQALDAPRNAVTQVRQTLTGLGQTLTAGLRSASATPLNVDIGPHRRFDWLDMNLAEVKQIKDRLGGTVNDVVLAIVSGAVGRFLRDRGLRTQDLDFRAMVPVNTRSESDRGAMGNRVADMLVRLPVGERDPRQRLQKVTETTKVLKHSEQVRGMQAIEDLSDWTFASIITGFSALSIRARAYNMVVTNVPGPPGKTYFLGAPMQAVYPLVPLAANQALGVALFSYDGKLFWGFNADWDALPDLHDFVDFISREFDALRAAAAGGSRRAARVAEHPAEASSEATGESEPVQEAETTIERRKVRAAKPPKATARRTAGPRRTPGTKVARRTPKAAR